MPDPDAIVLEDGAKISFEVEGEGEPLLLLHGLTGCGRDWSHAGRAELGRRHRLIVPDLRGHGRSTLSATPFTQRQCALDVIALLDVLRVPRCAAVGMSLGGNTLLHLATLQPERVSAMVLVSAAPYFPEQARKLMRATPPPDRQPEAEWALMRGRHERGDAQIEEIWRIQREMAASYDDLNFTPPALSRIRARTLVVYGDRDPLYPVELAVELYRAIPRAALRVVPDAGHVPIFLGDEASFVQTSLAFLAGGAMHG